MNWCNVHLRVRCKCLVGIFCVYTVCTFYLLTFMFPAWPSDVANKKSTYCRSYRNQFCHMGWHPLMKKSFMTAVILRPVCMTMCEKVRKSHFVVFEFDFLTKRDWSKSSYWCKLLKYYILDNIRKNQNSLCMEKGYNAMWLCIMTGVGYVKWIIGSNFMNHRICISFETNSGY